MVDAFDLDGDNDVALCIEHREVEPTLVRFVGERVDLEIRACVIPGPDGTFVR